MKKYLLACLTTICALSMVGCGSKEEVTFEDKVKQKFEITDTTISELSALVEDLQAQVNILKDITGASTSIEFKKDDVNLDSVRVASTKIKKFENSVAVLANSEMDVLVDIVNTTDKNLSDMVCQLYVVYEENGKMIDRHFVDARFDVLSKSTRRDLKFEKIPVKSPNIKHTLKIELKDKKGNVISSFIKEIFPK